MSYRGDDRIDLVGRNRGMERARNRLQDHYSGDEENQRQQDEAAAESKQQWEQARLSGTAGRPWWQFWKR